MPELPEVEVIRLGLSNKIIGLKIQKVQVVAAKSFLGKPNLIEGQKILKLWRKAKILGIDLDGISNIDYRISLLFHLKMTGQLIYVPNDKRLTNNDKRFIGGHPTEDMTGKMPNKHTRIIFSFSDGSHLYFNDQRKFGWIKIGNINDLKNLGPEPLDKAFTWGVLKQGLLKHPSLPVKVTIMDQSVIAGLGNIYANEACFDAKINPARLVKDLTDVEFKSLYKGVIKSLQDGIKYGGSSRANFVDSEGHKGYYLDYAYCYARNKQECKICGTEIKKISLGGRGTYLCPNCQK